MNDVSTCRQFVWFQLVMVACLLSTSVPAACAQGSFQPQGGPAYSKGSAPRSTPGVSKFDPDSTKTKTHIFGQPTRPTFSSEPTRSPQEDTFSRQSSIGQTSESNDIRCTVEYYDVVDFPALETGALLEMNVREGDTVPAGTTIAKIDDVLLKHQLRQALIRKNNAVRVGNDVTSIKAARKQIDLTRKRYETTRNLFVKGARSADEKMTAHFELERSQLQLQAAYVQQRDARGEAELESARASEVEDRIKRHIVASKFDGQVVDRYKQEGEWVTAGEPVARVARMDKLFVAGLLQNRQYNPAEVYKKKVVITAELARNESVQFEGEIVAIGPKVIQGTGNEFSVKAVVTNKMKQGQWVLREGSSVTMKILNE